MSNKSDSKTSYLINSQVPEFVRQDHPKFVEFLEAYHRFLEQEGGVGYVSKNFADYLDIDSLRLDLQEHIDEGITDTQYDVLLQKYYENFMKFLPVDVLADRNIMLKHILDFYRSKGTEKSVRFLLRIMFNKEPTFYYPKRDILKTSDGKWFVEQALRIIDVAKDNVSNSTAVSFFANTRVRGAVSNATAIVERVDNFLDNGEIITELKVSNLSRDFVNGEEITTFFTDEWGDHYLTANLYSGVVIDTTIINGGAGYKVGTYLPVESVDENTGTGAQIIITETTTGSIKAIGVDIPGSGFVVDDTIAITGGSGSGASGKVLTVDKSGNTHPNSYTLIGNTVGEVANIVYSSTVEWVGYAYANLATIFVTVPSNTSNLTVNTGMISEFTFTHNVRSSNVSFGNNSVLNVNNNIVIVNTTNAYTNSVSLVNYGTGNLKGQVVKVLRYTSNTNTLLTVNTGSGDLVATINLSNTVENSNASFTNGSILRVNNKNVIVISAGSKSNTILISPSISGNLVSNNLWVLTKAESISNLSVDTQQTQWIYLNQNLANSNVFFRTGDVIQIGTQNVTITNSSPSSNSITVFPGLTSNLVANNIIVFRTPFNAYSNLTCNTGSGASVTLINLSANVRTSNVYFETYDSLNVDGTIVLITSCNAVSNTITVSPGLSGNLVANGFAVIKKPNANTVMANSFNYWTFTNCGPVVSCRVTSAGAGYSELPTQDIRSNTIIRSLGILGSMKIVSGGLGYAVNDKIQFDNQTFGFGSGASANVTKVNAAGAITEVKFVPVDGHFTGGSGYENGYFPTCNIISSGGSGANVIVSSLLGDGETLIPVTDTIGTIQKLLVVAGGSGYLNPPTVNTAGHGDGTAQVTTTIVTGAYKYKGRFVNDSGHLSSYNFIHNRHYYQDYSYVIRVDESINKYRKVIKDLVHPTGTIFFGEYMFVDEYQSNMNVVNAVNTTINIEPI